MNFARSLATASAAAIVSFVLAACGGGDESHPATGTTMVTLSNRADLVSGGTALVEVKVPTGFTATSLKVDRDGTDVTAAFATRADGRTVGLVTGLKTGANTITARSSNGTFTTAQLVITNHPVRRPGPAQRRRRRRGSARPRCRSRRAATRRRRMRSGLSTAATDAQCNIATEFKLWYRTKTPVSVASGDGGCSFAPNGSPPDPTPTIANPNADGRRRARASSPT